VAQVVRGGLAELHTQSQAFRQVDQAEAVLRLVFDEVLPAYRRFHRDLLFHQDDEGLFRPFFIGRVCQAVLTEGGPWEETERIVAGAIKRLNDFLGHRPIAVLRNEQRLQAYAHEWVAPIPLFIAGAGLSVGPYRELVEKTLEILRTTESELLQQAWFDPEALEELSLDPRAYDFEHPVNRRPNHHFGGWDPHHIDLRGRYRRFIVQQVTLDALLSRLEERRDLPRAQVLFEAAAVLAGTMLMGSGVSGSGPDAHDSSVTLAKLLPHIAAYRDAFYERLVEQLPAAHKQRLRAEAAKLRQPFGGVRQHLNHALARRRAEQLQHVHLALLFARMGYTEAAGEQARIVPVASARMRTEISCRLTSGHLVADRGQWAEAARLLPDLEDLLHRAIHCGALIDPWNILGFGGQFSLFPAVENSIYDHRVDELIELMEEIFGLYARLEKEAAAAGQNELQEHLSQGLAGLARWWDQFATTEVSDVDGFSGHQMWESAAQVSTALGAWHRGGTAASDVAFWRQHVERFSSPKAFALLVEALLDLDDPVSSMALLTYWLSRADEIPLAEGDYAFHPLAVRWMEQLWNPPESSGRPPAVRSLPPEERWPLARKFLDYLEANGELYWQVPQLELVRPSSPSPTAEPQMADEDEEDNPFRAAYENVTYRDTTDDGFEGEMMEWGDRPTDFELTAEAERISDRLAFLRTVARLWKLAAQAAARQDLAPAKREAMSGWLAQAASNRGRLAELLASVHRYRIPPPRSTQESLVEYAQRQGIKEMLLERVIVTSVDMADAGRLLWGVLGPDGLPDGWEEWEPPAQRALQAAVRGDAPAVRAAWPELLEILVRQPLLYIPTSKGGSPQRVVASRTLQRTLHRLLAAAGRLGLLDESFGLIVTIQEMERQHPAGPGAFTEFDRLFETGCRALCECLVASSQDWPARKSRGRRSEHDLIGVLERATEALLARWLDHSRNIRLSVLETVADNGRWKQVKQFIERYGHDLFTQRFMNFGNLRAILHQGAEVYLRALEADEDLEEPINLLEDLRGAIPRETAASLLELTLEAVLENYSEYIDYNSTTTQSDRGEMLYTLLDFLRVEASYDRVAWNLKPVVQAHEVLVRSGRAEAAGRWREAVVERTAAVAEQHLKRFEQLCQKYGMRLPSIADRLQERFVRPLDVDRLCARIGPAMEQLRAGQPPTAFRLLQEELAQFTEEPSGVGFDVPSWLETLENEVQRLRLRVPDEEDPLDVLAHVPQVKLSLRDVERQMDEWDAD
jgi:hypothetical protein